MLSSPTFFLVRRVGADADAWEHADQEQVDALQGNPHFEVRRCLDLDRLDEWLEPKIRTLVLERLKAGAVLLTEDDRARLVGIAGEIEHLPVEVRRHLDQDGRDARFLRILAGREADGGS